MHRQCHPYLIPGCNSASVAGTCWRSGCMRRRRGRRSSLLRSTCRADASSTRSVLSCGPLTGIQRSLLSDRYRSGLEVAEENGVESMAFCCISTGAFGFPQREPLPLRWKRLRNLFQLMIGSRRWYAMCSVTKISQSIRNSSRQIRQLIEDADAGLSLSAGFSYDGKRFQDSFTDFMVVRRFHDSKCRVLSV